MGIIDQVKSKLYNIRIEGIMNSYKPLMILDAIKKKNPPVFHQAEFCNKLKMVMIIKL